MQAQLECSMGTGTPAESSPDQSGGEGDAAPLGVPMVDELLADSFLRRLFGHFYETLATASDGPHQALQVGLLAASILALYS